MRIIFMGTPDFAVPSLQMLIEEPYEIVAVVTQPDRPKGRKKELTPPPVKKVAEKYQIPVLQPNRIRDPIEMEKVIAMKPDLIVTAAFGQILPKPILEAPRLGCINVHASLLPKYRGGAPIQQAIMDGQKVTGVTILYMVEELDAGDMIAQREVSIRDSDHAGSMHETLANVGAELLKEVIPQLERNEIIPIPQDETEATYAPNLQREDEKIDWHRTAEQLEWQIRGLYPWPVAFTTFQGQIIKVWWAEAMDSQAVQSPGTVQEIEKEGIIVATGNGCLLIKELQPAGKKRMSSRTFLRGRALQVGDRFGE